MSLVRLRLVVVLADLEVAQLVRLFVGRHHPQPVAEVVLLQVLLCQVLEVPGGEETGQLTASGHLVPSAHSPLRELLLRRDVDLVLHAADTHYVTKVTCLAVDLDPLLQEGFLSERAE